MNKRNIIKIIAVLILSVTACLSVGIAASAEEGYGIENVAAEDIVSDEEGAQNAEGIVNVEEGAQNTEVEPNLFGEIYALAEENADKIFSALAFIGTLVVSITYKSGLLPLLSDALAKFKGALEGMRSENERFESETDGKIVGINKSVESVLDSVKSTEERIAGIEKTLVAYEESAKERESIKIILSSQIDMLYSIFMTSSLPHFEKEEIGNKILKMREELNSYESAE